MYSQNGAGGYPGQQQQQYQQQQQQQQQQQPQQQQQGFQPQMAPQQTGFQGYQQTGYGVQQPQPQPMQAQFTGFPGAAQQLQQQVTGFPGAQQQQYQPTGLQQQFTGYQQPQSAFAPQNTSAPPPMPQMPSQYQRPQPPPQTTTPTPQSIAPPPPNPKDIKIPNVRLSFITAHDQTKFEQLFKAATAGQQALSGDKSRDLLMKSGLPPTDLHQIWSLSDTTRSGGLMFPEFALAMYLCNLKRQGKQLPQTLPEVIMNEVSSMVDIISFGVPDDHPPAPPPKSNAPSFEPTPQYPPRNDSRTPTQSNSSLLGGLASQPTGFPGMQSQQTGFQPQQTGYQQSQPTGFQQSQPTGFQQPQPTGFQIQQPTGFQMQQPTGIQSQQTGFQGANGGMLGGNIPPMPPIPTGMSSLAPGGFLQSQPTGIPGQWGFVNTPSTGLPGLEALQQQLMPQPGRESGFSMQGLKGNAKIPWAITKVEKQLYDKLFETWDGLGKGVISGDVAIEIFSQSGLPKEDLMRIWTLADAGDKGKLDKDEFAVAMHLIYRKVNGNDIPSQLPPELIPPSTKKFSASVDTVKGFLAQGRQPGLQSQQTGVSYLKNRSFHGDSNASASRKDGTVYKFDESNAGGYKSSARHRVRGGETGRSPSPAAPGTPAPEEMTLDQLRKKTREKQILLDAIDIKDEARFEDDDALDRRDRRDADDLYRRIRRVQEDIDDHPSAGLRSTDSDAERRQMKRQLQNLTDRLPDIASKVRSTERRIADAKLELFRLRDAREYPDSASTMVGTGPGGSITESDRLKAKSRIMMQQRLAALTGKPVAPVSEGSDEAASKRLADETARVSAEKSNNERMTRDVEQTLNDFRRTLEDSLNDIGGDRGSSTSEHERRRWEDALGVEDEVKDFIFDLQRQSRGAKLRREDDRDHRNRGTNRYDDRRPASTRPNEDRIVSPPPARAATVAPAGGASYSSFTSAEERAAFIKQQAEQKMAERLAALGINHNVKLNLGESPQERLAREQREKDERLRAAEEDDARREKIRQQRLAADNPAPPPSKKNAPPPPPSRKNEIAEAQKIADERAKVEVGKTLQAEREAVEMQRHQLEDETSHEEEELAREQEAAQARLRALEEQMQQKKLKKKEESQKKKAALAAQKDKEAQVASMRAKLEQAKAEEERLLQLQREMDEEDSSSDEEGPEEVGQLTPTQEKMGDDKFPAIATPPSPPPAPPMPPVETPAAATSPAISSPPVTSPSVTSPPASGAESKNPFFKKQFGQPLNLNGESGSNTAASSDHGGAPASNNPFYKIPDQDASGGPAPNVHVFKPADEDDWSVVDDDESSSDDDDMPNRKNTADLARTLFATMAPPRPLSSMGREPTPTNSTPGPSDGPSAPPPAPPMPGMGGPPPPPPPPPMPGMGGPPGPPPPPPPPPDMGSTPAPPRPAGIGGLLGEIGAGMKLKKTVTKDKSTPASTGRVL